METICENELPQIPKVLDPIGIEIHRPFWILSSERIHSDDLQHFYDHWNRCIVGT